MTDLDWVECRTPAPPGDLADTLRRTTGGLRADATADAATATLAAAAREALCTALENPGRVRTSAFHLLAADGLLTYACEAALETDDPEEGLTRLLAIGAAR